MMNDSVIDRVADWLDGATVAEAGPPADIWACVEIFGHRKHYGRIKEIERFGTKMLRVDVPAAPAAPLFGSGEKFETFVYGGAAIFSLTPMTEAAARKWAENERRPAWSLMGRLPAPNYDDGEDIDNGAG